MALEYAALAGELLLQARVQMPQAQWRLWLEEDCTVPEEMAHTCMGLAQALPGQKPALVPYVAQGSLRGVLEELTAAVPERERRRQFTEAWGTQIAAMTAQLPPLERALDEAADVFRLLQLQQRAVALQSRAAACHQRCRQEAGRLLKELLVSWSSVHGALDPEAWQALSALLEEAQGQPPADEALAASDASRPSCEAPAPPTSPEENVLPLPEDP
ncbi:MAG: hypothetical protein M3Z21_10525 [Pseudomonadota bacterium]|nr:hypothetical protein [Pseudomonadota bacterium]